MPINFSQPTESQSVPARNTSTRDAILSLAKWLEGETVTSPSAGIKRLSGGVIQEYNGAAWVEKSVSYFKKAGDQLAGPLVLGGNITGPSTAFAYTLGANPDASVTVGGYFQPWGSASANPGMVVVGNNVTNAQGKILLQTKGALRQQIDNDGQVSWAAPDSGNHSINGRSLPGTAGDQTYIAQLFSADGNATSLTVKANRLSSGTTHASSELRLQRRVDATDYGYIGLASDGGRRVVLGNGSGGEVRYSDGATPTLTVTGNVQASGGSVLIGSGGATFAGSLSSDASWGMLIKALQASPGTAQFGFQTSAGADLARLYSSGSLRIFGTSPSLEHETGGQRVGSLSFSTSGGRSSVSLIGYDTAGANPVSVLSSSYSGAPFLIGSTTLRDNTGNAYLLLQGGGTPDYLFQSHSSPFRFAGGNVVPSTDNTLSCGASGARWSTLWAANGVVQTSDARDKIIEQQITPELASAFVSAVADEATALYRWTVGGQQVERVQDGEEVELVDDIETVQTWMLDRKGNRVKVFAERPIKRELRRPRYVDRVTEQPGKRLHAGFLAQGVETAFKRAGLRDFGGFVVDGDKQHLRYDQMIPFLYVLGADLLRRVQSLEAKNAS